MLTLGIIENLLNITLPKWGIFLIDAILFFVLIQIIYFVFKKVFKALASKTKTTLDDDIIAILEYPLLISVVIIFLLITIKPLDINEIWSLRIIQISKSIILLMVIWFLYNLIGIIYSHVFMKIAKKTESPFDDQLYPVIRKVLRIITVFFCFIYLLNIWNIDLTPILAGVGVGGLALAFAAQKMIADLFGGIVIFSDKPFKIGDRVKIDSNLGIIKEVGLRSTKIENFDGNIVIYPNAKVVESLIENFSMPNSSFVIKQNLGLVYNTPNTKNKLAKKIITDSLKSIEGVKKDSITVFFTEFKDWSLNLYLKFTITDISKKSAVLDTLNLKIKREFEKAKIEFAYPTQTIVLENQNK